MVLFEAIAAASGLYSAFSSSSSAKRTAAAAEADAMRLRQAAQQRAKETGAALGSEIDTLRSLRSADSPVYQQSAQIAFLQARKGSERIARNRAFGQMDQQVRDAVFGGQFEQYIGRESQKIQRYVELTEKIHGMAAEQQRQVNQIRSQGDAAYAAGITQAREMELAAGDPFAKALGAVAQGLSLTAGKEADAQALEDQRVADRKEFFAQEVAKGNITGEEAARRLADLEKSLFGEDS